LGWINLIYEIIQEAIILPLFYFIGKVLNDKKQLTSRIKSGIIFTGIVYSILAIILIIFVKKILIGMAAGTEILETSTIYIRIESIANIFAMLLAFVMVVFTSIGKEKYLYWLLGGKLVLSLFLDIFFVSTLPFSLNLGVNGIGYSNIISNIILLIISFFFLKKEEIIVIGNTAVDFLWLKELGKIGGISGLESFVRNVAYMVMISRMVNVVGEQGTYWVANNFIWGWLLLPINALAELIKRDCGKDWNAIKNNTLGYLFVTIIICIIWCLTIPLWQPFMKNVLQFSDVDKLFGLVVILLGFYILYALQNIFDATFYGIGKTNYMLFESIVTNTIYYGIAYILFIKGIWIPTLSGIALLFGIGMAFDSLVSLAAYIYLLKKNNINILSVE
jgi:Na+-driven multidrug efflux pump